MIVKEVQPAVPQDILPPQQQQQQVIQPQLQAQQLHQQPVANLATKFPNIIQPTHAVNPTPIHPTQPIA